MELRTFREYVLLLRRAEYLEKISSQAYKDDPEAIEHEYRDVNDDAVCGLAETTAPHFDPGDLKQLNIRIL